MSFTTKLNVEVGAIHPVPEFLTEKLKLYVLRAELTGIPTEIGLETKLEFVNAVKPLNAVVPVVNEY
ncbi:hypothetical protein AQBE111736_10895 [Aquirufa beregesia]